MAQFRVELQLANELSNGCFILKECNGVCLGRRVAEAMTAGIGCEGGKRDRAVLAGVTKKGKVSFAGSAKRKLSVAVIQAKYALFLQRVS